MVPFISWVGENGLDLNLFLSELVRSKISLFAWLDVMVSALAVFVFSVQEKKKRSLKHIWIPVVATCCIGVSLGLPLLLLMKELQSEKVA